jgi:hypothetical protein
MPRNSLRGGEDGALDAKPAWHIAAHHANFPASAICENAIYFAELTILARQGMAGFAPNP